MKRTKFDPEDIIGKTYGRLTVAEYLGKIKGKYRYRCQCSCGGTKEVIRDNLLSSTTRSCGCLRKDMDNGYMIGRRYGSLVIMEFVGTRDERGYFKCQCDCGNVVEVRRDSLTSGRTISCGCYDRLSKNIAKAREKLQNETEEYGTPIGQLTKVIRNSPTGVKGVGFSRNGKYRARIGLQGKEYHLGTFETLEEAIRARKHAEEELFAPILEKRHKKNTP